MLTCSLTLKVLLGALYRPHRHVRAKPVANEAWYLCVGQPGRRTGGAVNVKGSSVSADA